MTSPEAKPIACPVDAAVLLPTAPRGPLECPTCGGSWFPQPRVAAEFGPVARPHPAFASSRSDRRCPVDGGELMTTAHRGVEINVCATCTGVWLDAGERTQLLTGARQPSRPHEVEAARDVERRGQALEKVRETIRRPPLWHALFIPVAIAMILLAAALVPEWVGWIVVVVLLAFFGGRALVTPADVQRLEREHEATLDAPLLNRMLGGIEKFAFLAGALLSSPACGRLLLGGHRGEVGMGGIVFLFAGLIINFTLAAMALWIARRYLQDNYGARLLFDATFIGLIALMIGYQ
jgi:Zn-finger nucleic acid-binding protein